MIQLRRAIVFLLVLSLLVFPLLSLPSLMGGPQSSIVAQTAQHLGPASIIINYVESREDDAHKVTAIELFDGGAGQTDLSNLVLLVADERREPVRVEAIPLADFATDEHGLFTIGGPNSSTGRALFMTDRKVLPATVVGLLDLSLHEELIDANFDASILTDERLTDKITIGNDGFGLASLATQSPQQPVAPVSSVARIEGGTIPGGTIPGGTIPGGTIPPASDCGSEATLIHEIQGDGATSPLVGQTVIIEAMVIGDFQDTRTQLRGFFVQEEDADADDNLATSEGLFVFDNGFGVDVAIGDKVRIAGDVAEFFTLTELKNLTAITICEGDSPVMPTHITLPETVDGELERVEGMLVEIDTEMTIAQNYFLGRYGQMTLSADGRAYQPTSLFAPGSAEAQTQADENARRLLVLDDGQDIRALGDNPVPVPYLGVAPPQILRAGDTVTNLVGVIDFGRINSAPGRDTGRDYRLHPIEPPLFEAANRRTAGPANVGGTLRVGSFNLFNYFNGDGRGNGFPTERGARSFSEFQRQRAKIVAAIIAMDVDIIGLMELENDGYGEDSAIQDLVDNLNAVAPRGAEYAAIDPGLEQLGGDAIAVGIIYNVNHVQPVGEAATLDAGAFDQTLPSGRSRQPLAQTFEDFNEQRLTIVVNHFKSKRPSDNPTDGNADMGPGIGAWNERRTEAAQDLIAWLDTDPTLSGDADFLVLGDLNAYAQETPITAFTSEGYINLLARSTETRTYTFIFDGQAGYLDHALASGSLIHQVKGSTEWHINTDEPKVIDYDERFNPPGYFSPDLYRSSDHDPLIVGLTLEAAAASPPDGGVTPVITPTATITATAMPTATVVTTATVVPTATVMPTVTTVPTATTMPTVTVVPTTTPIISPTVDPAMPYTVTLTATPVVSPTVDPAMPYTATLTATPVVSPTVDPAMPYTVTLTATPAPTVTVTMTATPVVSPTVDPAMPYTATLTATPVVSPTVDPAMPYTVTLTATPVVSPTVDPAMPYTVTLTATPAPTVTVAATPVVSPTLDVTPIPVVTPAPDVTATPEATPAPIVTPTDETPADETPADETPADETPAEADGAVVPTARAYTYVAVYGDHLSRIARRYSVTIAALAKANNMNIHTPLRVGQRLTIPPVTDTVSCVRHLTASAGDQLDRLAAELEILPEGLGIINGLSPTAVLAEGQQICLPDVYSDGYYNPPRHYRSAYGSHIVRPGETLSHISARFGVSIGALQRLNGLGNPDHIYSGQWLTVPR